MPPQSHSRTSMVYSASRASRIQPIQIRKTIPGHTSSHNQSARVHHTHHTHTFRGARATCISSPRRKVDRRTFITPKTPAANYICERVISLYIYIYMRTTERAKRRFVWSCSVCVRLGAFVWAKQNSIHVQYMYINARLRGRCAQKWSHPGARALR